MRSGLHRFIATVDDLRARCRMAPVPKPTQWARGAAQECWLWGGATSSDGLPRVHAVDLRTQRKVTMIGTRAAWSLSRGAAPHPDRLVARCCGVRLCLNPAHLREFADRKELGAFISREGWRVGTSVEQRRATQVLAVAAQGRKATPIHIVQAIKDAPPEVSTKALAERFGLKRTTASHIRTGRNFRHVLPSQQVGA